MLYHLPTVNIDLHDTWFLGPVEIPGRLVLAPMAGVSVQAFRRQGRRYGAALVCSEMVSVAGIQHRNERTLGYLRVGADEHPLAIQIFGSDPIAMAEAARMVEAAGADIVDINFGCPVRKVTKTGAGAIALTDPGHAAAIVEAISGAVSVPVTAKMRRGVDDGSPSSPSRISFSAHGFPCAARPIITAAAPVVASTDCAFARDGTAPDAITGTSTSATSSPVTE